MTIYDAPPRYAIGERVIVAPAAAELAAGALEVGRVYRVDARYWVRGDGPAPQHPAFDPYWGQTLYSLSDAETGEPAPFDVYHPDLRRVLIVPDLRGAS
jgi:hypothetical protein